MTRGIRPKVMIQLKICEWNFLQNTWGSIRVPLRHIIFQFRFRSERRLVLKYTHVRYNFHYVFRTISVECQVVQLKQHLLVSWMKQRPRPCACLNGLISIFCQYRKGKEWKKETRPLRLVNYDSVNAQFSTIVNERKEKKKERKKERKKGYEKISDRLWGKERKLKSAWEGNREIEK